MTLYRAYEKEIEVVSFTVKNKIKRAGPLQAVKVWVEKAAGERYLEGKVGRST